ncbi:transglycosylase SLT domain-containing protein [Pseudoxanthomonas mexicana]
MPVLVPRSSGPQVAVRDAPNARNTARMDTSQLQAGIRQVGAVAENYFARQVEQFDTARLMEARADLANWYSSVKDPNNARGLQAYQGENALKLGDELLPDLDKTIGTITARLTPNQRQQFDGIASEFRTRVRDDFMSHMDRQAQVAMTQKNAAMNQALTSEAVLAGLDGNFAAQQVSVVELLAANDRMGQLKGLPAEVMAQGRQALASTVYRQTIMGQLTRDPSLAQRYFEQVDDKLTAEDLIAVEDVIYPTLIAERARRNAQTFLDGGPVAGDGYNGIGDGQTPPDVPEAIRRTIEDAADKHGVPRHIALAMAQQESGFNPKAVGPETKWGRAKGLFQYLDSTAAGMGIDALNPEQAADAAMKQLAEQAKARGWDWAIAHHHAGPNSAQHGPKTRRYVAEIQAKARRFGAGSGGGFVAPAASPQDAFARAEAITDERERQQTLQEMRTILARRKAEAEVQEQRMGEAIYAKATQGERLSPDEIHFLAINPKYKEAIDRYQQLTAAGQMVKDDPVLVDHIHRMRAQDQNEFRSLKLAQYADRLSGKTMLDLVNAQKELDDQDWLTDAERVESGLTMLGLGSSQDAKGFGSGKKNEPRERMRGEFRIAFQNAEKAFIQRQGAKPTPEQADKLVRLVAQQFAQRQAAGKLFSENKDGKEVGVYSNAAGFQTQVSEDDRAKVRAAWRAKYGVLPTDAQITNYIVEKRSSAQ